MADIHTLHISDLHEDPENARSRTERSSALISKSIEEVGFARAIVIDGSNRIRAGNGSFEEATQLGYTKVLVIDTDGTEIVAIRRKDLTSEKAKRLAYLDNRTSELSVWKPEQIKIDLETQAVKLNDLFSERELKKLFSEPVALGVGATTTEVTAVKTSCTCPNCGCTFKPV